MLATNVHRLLKTGKKITIRIYFLQGMTKIAYFCSPEQLCLGGTHQKNPSSSCRGFLFTSECESIPQLFSQWSLLYYPAAWQEFFFLLFVWNNVAANQMECLSTAIV